MKHWLSGNVKYYVLGVSLVLVIVSLVLMGRVNTNYDMTQYLPDDTNTLQGLTILEENFGNHAVVQFMMAVEDVNEAMDHKASLNTVEGIMQVAWLDDVIDISIQLEFYDEAIILPYYHDGYALFTIVFIEDDYSESVEQALYDIDAMFIDENYHMRGPAVNHRESRRIAEGEVITLILMIVPICIIILLFASKSYLEPLLLLISLGVAVLLNMGTNIIFPHVSYITLTLAAALQLAVSLDYSLFLTHRFYEEKEKGLSSVEAAGMAIKHTFPSITASALTTISGFMALALMQYTIGRDIGFVLSKGIFFSYVAVFTVLPALLVICTPWLDKLKHRNFTPSFAKAGQFFYKFRYALTALFVILLVGSFVLQGQASYRYSNRPRGESDTLLQTDMTKMKEVFGPYQPLMVLVENDTEMKEAMLVNALMGIDGVIFVETLLTIAPEGVPREFLPPTLTNQYIGPTHTRFIIYSIYEEENDALFTFYDDVTEQTEAIYGDAFNVVGFASGTSEIKAIVTDDTVIVSLSSIIAIAIILIIVFKSPLIPVLLIGVIQTAIWINVSLSVLTDMKPIYIGFLVVFALQLGATIDYAVLLTGRYFEFRKEHSSVEAMKKALDKAMIPVMISALVLSSAGFAVTILFYNLSEVMEIGLLIGRGALISLVSVGLFLPVLLIWFDPLIMKTKISFTKPKR